MTPFSLVITQAEGSVGETVSKQKRGREGCCSVAVCEEAGLSSVALWHWTIETTPRYT